MFKSEMCKIYNTIYSENRANKVFNSRMDKICNLLNDKRFYNKLKVDERGYYDRVIMVAINKEKNLNYEIMAFFLPLIYEYDYKIVNFSNNISVNEFYTWITRLSDAQILIREKFNNYMKENILDPSIRKISSNMKKSPNEKTKLIIEFKEKFNFDLKKIEDIFESNFYISGAIYVKLYDFIIEKLVKDDGIEEMTQNIIKYIKYTSPAIRLNIVPKLDKILSKELLKYKDEIYKVNASDLDSIDNVDMEVLSEKIEKIKKDLSLGIIK